MRLSTDQDRTALIADALASSSGTTDHRNSHGVKKIRDKICRSLDIPHILPLPNGATASGSPQQAVADLWYSHCFGYLAAGR
jgi:hypothetical protein